MNKKIQALATAVIAAVALVLTGCTAHAAPQTAAEHNESSHNYKLIEPTIDLWNTSAPINRKGFCTDNPVTANAYPKTDGTYGVVFVVGDYTKSETAKYSKGLSYKHFNITHKQAVNFDKIAPMYPNDLPADLMVRFPFTEKDNLIVSNYNVEVVYDGLQLCSDGTRHTWKQ